MAQRQGLRNYRYPNEIEPGECFLMDLHESGTVMAILIERYRHDISTERLTVYLPSGDEFTFNTLITNTYTLVS